MAPTKMAPAPAKAAEKATLSRRFDFPELGASGTLRKRASQEAVENIVVRTSDGVPIPHVPGLRVLGMFVDGTQTNATAVKNITTKMGVAARLIKRVSSRYRGMNERRLLRLLQAFVVSHAAYAGAFHRWTCAERAKIDAAIRKAYTGALGLLPGTKTTALLSLGAHNTLPEISEAQSITAEPPKQRGSGQKTTRPGGITTSRRTCGYRTGRRTGRASPPERRDGEEDYRLPAAQEHRPRERRGQASGTSGGAGPSAPTRRQCSLRGRRKVSEETQRLCSGGGPSYYTENC
ncbi:hypothetical protein HPB50_021130 [Hyalomma asiaticum]|uniref:Uncharacterized protein n=1 Tax=Hyalomma asiaticum TaxID=266040 RepID=A0ACB7TS93_HYAAI|nr:hypothetical protein HPB50_021130 [Hyalomma asiaticum]